MPTNGAQLHHFLADCLCSGTAEHEKGKSVRIEPKADEVVLLFKTDHATARKYLGITAASDVVFLYVRHQQPPRLVFVELKGSDLKKAADQLSNTIAAVKRRLTQIIGPSRANVVRMTALVVFSGAVPKANFGKIQKDFFSSTGIALNTQRETADLRPFM